MTPEEAIERLAAAKNNLERAEIVTALTGLPMRTIEEKLAELEAEVQALMKESETQKLVNAELSRELRAIRKTIGSQSTTDRWADLKDKGGSPIPDNGNR